MALAELLPAVEALTREEKLELVRIVNDQLGKDVTALLLEPGVVHHAGYGMHEAHEGAAALMRLLEEERRKAP
jgi:hypothetical protein